MSLSIYGKQPSGQRLKRIQSSPNYQKGSFQNLTPTNAMSEDASFYKMMREYMNKPKLIKPSNPLPTIETNLKKLLNDDLKIVWFGHSSYMIKIEGKTILVDPVLSGNAAPVSCMVKSFKGSDWHQPNDFPEIDVLVITHDHYDHLDYKTVLALKKKVKNVVCALGVGSHLEHWGYDVKLIYELDWWEEANVAGFNFIATPSRHFSGRGIKRGQTLWASFVLKAMHHQLFIGGDSGYGTHFVEIGNRFGKFDIAILESGQYNKMWKHIHMMPEETVQASLDLNANYLMPVHWAKFSLAMHVWNEPIQRIINKAEELNVKTVTPIIGEAITPATHKNTAWWEGV